VTATQIAEAVRVGPFVMPHFDQRLIDRQELDSLVRYVLSTREPDNRGGWAIGNLGPIPEGMVAWLLAGAALVAVARLIGRRTE
jgi:ubiquinol-cytochrome c reductase cytochrome c subunit